MTRTARLATVGGLNVALVVALIVVGVAAHSLGVLAEGADYLGDAAAIGVSLLAIRVSGRRPRATTVAAAINAGWLVVLSLLVTVDAIVRLAHGVHKVDGSAVLIVSGAAAVVMGAGAFILGDADDDLNMRAVLLDTAADAAAAAGAAVAGAVILATGRWYWLDPTVALAISTVVAYHGARLLRDVHKAWPDRS